MKKRFDSDEFEFLEKKESKFSARKALEESYADEDLQESVSVLTKETIKENKRVVMFMEELRTWKGKVSKEGYISIKLTDYENLKQRIEELESQLLLKQNGKGNLDTSFELKDLQEELKYKNDLLKTRDDELADMRKQL